MSALEEAFFDLDAEDLASAEREDAEPFEFEAVVLRTTERAVLYEIGPDIRVQQWIPKSLLLEGTEARKTGEEGAVFIPQWFAEQEGVDDLVHGGGPR